MNKVRFGIDLGGTKTELIALDNNGTTLLRERSATPQGDYEQIIANLAQMVRQAQATLSLPPTATSVGIGMPGSVSTQTGLVRNANTVVLNGRPFVSDVSAAIGQPVRVENDANCLVLSEATDGAAADAKIVFGVILGTGVGGGLCVNKHVITGANAIAGEWGHNPLPMNATELPGRACYCGKRGCIETWLSGPAFARQFNEKNPSQQTRASQDSEQLTAREIIDLASRGNQLALACFSDYVDRLSRALAIVVNILDPDVIVIGGGMSNVAALYPQLEQHLAALVFSDQMVTQIVPAMYGDSSGVRGAAWLWGSNL